MDFLNKTTAQFNDLFRSMTPGARITAGLLLAVVVVSLVYLFSYQMSSSDAYLLNGRTFDPDEFARVQAALGAKNLTCMPDGMRIKIPRGREAEYVAALADAGALPRGWNNMNKAVSSGSPFETSEFRKERIKLATEEELAFCISKLEEVENARVMFDKTTEGGLRKRVVASASVFAYPVGNRDLSARTVAGIRDLVSGALPPMKPEDVKVVNGLTGQSYFIDSAAGGGAYGSRYLKLTSDWEDACTAKIYKLLSDIPGVKARVTVILDPTESQSETKLTPDPKGTAAVTSEKEISRDHEGAVPAGRPGSVANQSLTLRANQAQGAKENESETEATTTNIVGGKTESKKLVGMTPIWMAASVVVPHSYLVSVWKQENPPAEGGTVKEPETKDLQAVEQRVMTRVRENVANLLPPDMKGVSDKNQLVTVTVGRDIEPEPFAEPSLAETSFAWLSENWRMLGLVFLALASLGLLRSTIKSAPLDHPVERRAQAALTVESDAFESEESRETEMHKKQQRRLANFSRGGASLRDELSELVKEDPDAAANILRTWIGSPIMKA